MDFLLLLEDTEKAEKILTHYGYIEVYKTRNVVRYRSPKSSFGSIDIIYSFRDISRNILKRSVAFKFGEDLLVKALVPEDIIGLKIQAIVNDENRFNRDFSDIQELLAAKNHTGTAIDWGILREYFELFDRCDLYQRLKESYA